MMDIFLQYGLPLLIAYLVGSISTAVWIGKGFFDIDVREHGSGNAGATNTFRVLGKKAGIPVLLLDTLKGWSVVGFFPQIFGPSGATGQLVEFQLLMGAGVVLGHIFPLYTKFKGGKGIATLLGVVLAIHFKAALVCLGIFLILFFVTKYVSLGAIAAALSFPVIVVLVFKTENTTMIHFSLIFTTLVLLTHQKNIERLLNREESKMSLHPRDKNKKKK